jgi:hypothetical protein
MRNASSSVPFQVTDTTPFLEDFAGLRSPDASKSRGGRAALYGTGIRLRYAVIGFLELARHQLHTDEIGRLIPC